MLVKIGERILLGRNFDWEPMFLTRHPLIVEYRPEGRLAVTSFGFVGVPGVIQGVNSAGLALTTNIAFRLYRDTDANNGPSIVLKNRAVLERASSLDAAERLYRAQPTDEAGWMITLASAAERDGAIIELYDNQVARSGLKQGRAHIHNILFDPARLGTAALSRRNTELKMALDEYNVRREFETSRKLPAVSSVDELLGYLGDTSFYGYRDVILTNCATINNDYTINTLVFDPVRQDVYYAVAPGFSALSKIYRYEQTSRHLTLYRPAEARFDDPVRQAKMRWFDAYLNLKYCSDYAAIIRLVDLNDPQLDPVQLRYAAEAWLKAPGAGDGAAIVAALERMSQRYPRYDLPHLYRAKLLAKLGRRTEAVQALDQTLACADSSPGFRLEAQLLLTELAGPERRKRAQAAYVAAIDELARTWCIEDSYRRPYERIKAELKDN
ncbi:MAG: Acyl-coenzyme A:6-aminopenicillanic acid acyl-transferase [Deltaproteobacteria bacterium ADurb.Bin510]|nr:MAG: Acyl-coenzyme A:6-aminopenicillanic acid acyl-transferase [Deltaproteobacteria bacterium ADurb.Bin510]